MAMLIHARRIRHRLQIEGDISADFKSFSVDPPRLALRVRQQRHGGLTLVLLALVMSGWGAVKFLQWQKWGGFSIGWVDAIAAAAIAIAALMLWAGARHRHIAGRGRLHPARVFIREQKRMIELRESAGDTRPRAALAGSVPTGPGVQISRQLFVEYEIDGETCVGSGSLVPGDLPALVRREAGVSFAVMVDETRPKAAALITEYDFEFAPGESS